MLNDKKTQELTPQWLKDYREYLRKNLLVKSR